MTSLCYPSDLTDAEWQIVEALLPPPKSGGRPRTTDLRHVLNAIFYLLRTGSPWRYLPPGFPPWPTVHYYYRTWRRSGVWWRIYQGLYPKARARAGRQAQPSAAVMDTQSVKTTEKGALVVSTHTNGFRAGSGRSRWTRWGSRSAAASSRLTCRTGR